MAQDKIPPAGGSAAQATADNAISQELIAQIDPWIDLQKPGTEAEVLMRHLTQRYAEATGAFLPGVTADPARLHALLKMLVQQLARAQADLFVLKSAVLGRDHMVLTRDWEYRDPLEVHRAALGRDAAAALPGIGRYNVPMDEDLLGFGWHATETKNTSSWRWSGPGLQSTLLLPRFFDGRVRVEIMFSTLRRDVLPATGALAVAGRPVAYVLYYPDATTTAGVITLDIDLAAPMSPQSPPQAFVPLTFSLAATYSPHAETGSNDKRELGICVKRIVISVTP